MSFTRQKNRVKSKIRMQLALGTYRPDEFAQALEEGRHTVDQHRLADYIAVRYAAIDDIIREDVASRRQVHPDLLVEFEKLKKFNAWRKKVGEKFKTALRKGEIKLKSMRNSKLRADMMRNWDIEDAEKEMLEKHVEKMGEKASSMMQKLASLHEKHLEFGFPNTDGDDTNRAIEWLTSRPEEQYDKEYFEDKGSLNHAAFEAMLNDYVAFASEIEDAHKKGTIETGDANEILRRITKFVQLASAKLSKTYRVFESKTPYYNRSLSSLLLEQEEGNEESEAPALAGQKFLDELGITDDELTNEMKKNNSWEPVIKKAMLGALFGQLAGSAAKGLAQIMKPSPEVVQTIVTNKPAQATKIIIKDMEKIVKPGEGLQKVVERVGFGGKKIQKVGQFKEALSNIGGGSAEQGIEQLVNGVDGYGLFGKSNGNYAKKAKGILADMLQKPDSASLGFLKGTETAGSGAAAGDALVVQPTEFIQKAAEKVAGSPKVTKVVTKVVKNAAPAFSIAATLVAGAPWAIGGMAVGGAIGALLRSNSKKNSRAAKIQNTYSELRDIELKADDVDVPIFPAGVDPTPNFAEEIEAIEAESGVGVGDEGVAGRDDGGEVEDETERKVEGERDIINRLIDKWAGESIPEEAQDAIDIDPLKDGITSVKEKITPIIEDEIKRAITSWANKMSPALKQKELDDVVMDRLVNQINNLSVMAPEISKAFLRKTNERRKSIVRNDIQRFVARYVNRHMQNRLDEYSNNYQVNARPGQGKRQLAERWQRLAGLNEGPADHKWEPATKQSLMLDREGHLEKSDRENVYRFLKSLKMLG